MTDLVFVDPVGTGYSREAPGQEARSFWGVDQDASVDGRLHPALSGAGGPHRRRRCFWPAKAMAGSGQHCLPGRCRRMSASARAASCSISPALEFTFLRPDEFQPLHWALELPSLAAVRLAGEGVSGRHCGSGWPRSNTMRSATISSALAGGLEQGGRLASQRVAEFTGLPLDTRRTELCAHHHGAVRQGIRHVQEAMSSAPMTARSKPPTSRPKVPARAARTRCSTEACRCSPPPSSTMCATN